ncbi:MAG: carboxypeptidase regulatory-like domain-containing protein [Gemmatimonadales bacterium]
MLRFVAVLLFSTPVALAAQTRQVTGRVTRAVEGTPVVGASVSVSGAATETTARTGEDGRYTISVPAGEVRLLVRAIGFTAVQATVPAGQSTLDIAMNADVFKLGDVVVTGQATTVGTAGSDDLGRLRLRRGHLQGGRADDRGGPGHPGGGAQPPVQLRRAGGGMQVQIRGNGTILGASDPLVVVDGGFTATPGFRRSGTTRLFTSTRTRTTPSTAWPTSTRRTSRASRSSRVRRPRRSTAPRRPTAWW